MHCGLSCFFRRNFKMPTRATLYAKVYLDPKWAAPMLYRCGVFSWHSLFHHAAAFIKHLVKHNRLPRHNTGSPESIFYAEFIEFFTDWFAAENPVPPERQQDFLRLCAIRLQERFFFPAQSGTSAYEQQVKEFRALLSCVDNTQILISDMPETFRHYFFLQKPENHAVRLTALPSGVTVHLADLLVLETKRITCEIRKIRLEGDQLVLWLTLKSSLFVYLPDCAAAPLRCTAICNDIGEVDLSLQDTSLSYDQSYEKTTLVYAARFSDSLLTLKTLRFVVHVGKTVLPLDYQFYAGLPLSGIGQYTTGAYKIDFDGKAFSFSSKSQPPDPSGDPVRCLVIKNAGKRVWLYSDYRSVPMDNGFYQFCHDFEKQDGVQRYYVSARSDARAGALGDAKYDGHVLAFGTQEHRICFLSAEKILAAFVDAPNCLCPFADEEFSTYADLFHAEIIYLQHGILQAHIPWKYSPVSAQFHADRIVISSDFETHNLTKNYHFYPDQLIAAGMPRYDHITRQRKQSRKILYAPSWRAFVTDITETAFFQGVMALVHASELHQFLEEADLILEIKLHPMLEEKRAAFSLQHPRIQWKTDEADPAEYQIFITDFSSYVFDFAYLSIPVIYFLPDAAAFEGGKYQYRSLDLPFSEGFGSYCTDMQALIAELQRLTAQHFQPDPRFRQRMETFFLPLNHCCEKIYREVQGDKKD